MNNCFIKKLCQKLISGFVRQAEQLQEHMRRPGWGMVRQSWDICSGHGIRWDHLDGFVHFTDLKQKQCQSHGGLKI